MTRNPRVRPNCPPCDLLANDIRTVGVLCISSLSNDEQANRWSCRSSRGQCVAKTCASCSRDRRQNVGTESATWSLVANGHKQMFPKRKVSRRLALGPGCPHRPQRILCSCFPLRRTVPPFFIYYHHLHILPRHPAEHRAHCAQRATHFTPVYIHFPA